MVHTLDKCELCSCAVDLVGDRQLVSVEITRLHFTDEETELEISAAN